MCKWRDNCKSLVCIMVVELLTNDMPEKISIRKTIEGDTENKLVNELPIFDSHEYHKTCNAKTPLIIVILLINFIFICVHETN